MPSLGEARRPCPVLKESLKSAKSQRDAAHKSHSGSGVETKLFEGNDAHCLGVGSYKRHLVLLSGLWVDRAPKFLPGSSFLASCVFGQKVDGC